MSNIIISPQSGIIEFNTGIAGSDSLMTSTAPIRLDATGGNSFITGSNFGIGTNNPQFTLDVDGSIHGTSGNFSTAITVGGNPVMTGVSPESDTLQTVTARGATSNQAISVSNSVTSNEFVVGNQGKVNSSSTVGLQLQSTSTNKPIIFLTNVAGQTERMRIQGDGKVGIGETAPEVKLEVAGDIMAKDSFVSAGATASQGYTFHDFGTGWGYKGVQSPSRLAMFTASAERVTIDADGKVGIGTTSPSQLLTLEGSSAAIKVSESGGAELRMAAGGSLGYVGTYNSNDLAILAGAGEKIRVKTDGKVGIGTVSPDSKLSVTSSTINSEDILYLKSGADSVNDYLGIAWEIGAGGNGPHSAIRSFAGPSGSDARLGFLTTSNGGTTLTEGLSVAHNGNVGIGTTSPAKTLDIVGEIRTSGRATFNEYVNTSLVFGTTDFTLGYAGGTSGIFIKGSTALAGNVGINTTAPQAKLHIAENDNGGNAEIILENSFNNTGSSTDETTQIQGRFGGFDGSYIITGKEGDYTTAALRKSFLSFSTRTATTGMGEKMRITSTGNVGIGTTNPSQKLHVVGNTTTTGVSYTDIVQTYSGSSIDFRHQDASVVVRVDTANARVGIGTTTPNEKLEVNGSVRVGNVKIQNANGGRIGLNRNTSTGAIYNNTFGGFQIQNNSATGFEIQSYNTSGVYTGVISIKQSNGNVGINTTDAGTKLEVDQSANTYSSGFSLRNAANVIYGLYVDGSNNLNFHYQGSPKVVFESGGDVLPATNEGSDLGSSSKRFASIFCSGLSASGSVTTSNIQLQSNLKILNKAQTSYLDLAARDTSGSEVVYNLSNIGSANFTGQIAAPAAVLSTTSTSDYVLRLLDTGVVGYDWSFPDTGTLKLGVNTTSTKTLKLINAGSGSFNLEADGATFSGSVTAPSLSLASLNAQNSENTALVINGSYEVGTRELGSNAFNSTSYLPLAGGTMTGVLTLSQNNVRPLRITGSNSNYIAMSIANTGSGNAGVYYDAINGDLAGSDYGFIGQEDAGYMLYNIGTSSPAPYHVFTGGNVGIGTTSPSAKLDVSITSGNAWMNLINGSETNFRLTTYNNGTGNGSNAYAFKHGLYYSTTENAAVTFYRGGSSTGGFLTFTTNAGSERMRIDSSGNVGIGTTGPTEKLEVNGNLKISSIGTGNSAPSYDLLFYGTTSSGTQTDQAAIHSSPWTTNTNGGNLIFETSNSSNALAERMRIDGAGNVGIGTTSPQASLHVAGYLGTTPTGNGVLMGLYTTGSSNYGNIQLNGDTGSFIDFSSSGTDWRGRILYDNSSNYMRFDTGGTERMRINSSGNVGIGTNGPSYKLHVTGTIYSVNSGTDGGSIRLANTGGGSNWYWAARTTGLNLGELGAADNRIFIKNGGNVGIGTNSPSAKLHVGSIGFSNYTTPPSTEGILFEHYYGSSPSARHAAIISQSSAYPESIIDFWTKAAGGSSSKKVTILGNGNVGIGTTNPTQIFHVAGNALLGNGSNDVNLYLGNSDYGLKLDYSAGDIFVRTSGANRLVVKNSGNVGIGTTSPSTALTIRKAISSAAYGAQASMIEFKSYFTGYDTETVKSAIYSGVSDTGTLNTQGGYMAFHVNNNGTMGEKLRIDKSGKVGIGTTSPSQKLQINGVEGLPATTGTSQNALLRLTPNAPTNGESLDFGMRVNGSDSVGWIQATNFGNLGSNYDIAINPNGGNVGIGTTSPSYKLQIHDGNAAITGGSSSNLFLNINTNKLYGDQNGVVILEGYDNLRFQTQGSERMRINSSGNVGIGTASPSRKLDVVGDAQVSTNLIVGTALYTNQWIANSSSTQFIKNNSSVTSVAITNAGNVGIGTASPSAPLQVFGTSAAPSVSGTFQGSIFSIKGSSTVFLDMGTTGASGYYAWMQAHDAGTGVNYKLAINPLGGNVGIGTTSPDYQLDIENSSHATARLHAGANSSASLRLQNDAQHFDVNLQTNDKFAIYDHTAGTQPFTILPTSGNVGIGTTSPRNKLDVTPSNGSFRISDYGGAYFGNSSDTGHELYLHGRSNGALSIGRVAVANLTGGTGGYAATTYDHIHITSAGNVGIGITDPDQKLDVNGNIRIPNQGKIVFGSAGTATDYLQLHDVVAGNPLLKLVQDNVERFSIEGVTGNVYMQGNVGIGTTSTTAKITLADHTTAAGGIKFRTAASSVSLWSSGSGNLNTDKSFNVGSRLRLVGGNAVADPDIGFSGATAGTGFSRAGQDITFVSGGAEKMRLDNDGNLGIGTADPNRLLQINGGHSTTRMRLFYAGSQNDRNAYIDMWASEPGVTYNGSGIGSNINGSPYYGRYVTELGQSYIRFIAGQLELWTGPASSGTASTALQRLTILDGGNVGIGTGSPDKKLNVHSGATSDIVKFQNNNGSIVIGKTANLGSLDMASDASFRIRHGSTVSAFFKSDGNVGIGTATPSSLLHLEAAASPALQIKDTTNNVTFKAYAQDSNSHLANTSNHDLFIDTNNTPRITVKAGGNVGIGTTSPNAKLDVNSGISTSSTDVLKLSQATNGAIKAAASLGISIQNGGESTNAADLWFTTATGGSLSERMRITSSGNVGIGTTSPSYKLDVNGTIGGTQLFIQGLKALDSSANFLYIDPNTQFSSGIYINNRVKIDGGLLGSYNEDLQLRTGDTTRLTLSSSTGNATFAADVDVNGITTSKTFRTNTSNTDYNVISRNSTSTTLWVQAAQSGSIQGIASFRYGSATVNQGTEVCAIRRNSSYFINTKLGVGTNNPATTLDVEGTIKHKVYTVSTLPSASPAGQRAFVSDSYYNLQQSHGSGVSGGGSNFCPVYSDGSNWFNG